MRRGTKMMIEGGGGVFLFIQRTLTSVRVFQGEVPVPVLAHVAAGAADVGLAVALAGHQRRHLLRIRHLVADPGKTRVQVGHCPVRLAVAGCKKETKSCKKSIKSR